MRQGCAKRPSLGRSTVSGILLYWLSIKPSSNPSVRQGQNMTSTRYEGDTWDLASSVGVTATMVAAARAVATRADNPLINDPFAEPLVAAVGVDLLARLASGELAPADIDDPERPNMSMARMADNMAIRTKFFDEFFVDATNAGIRQAVILASGLDSRAYRLPWPGGP